MKFRNNILKDLSNDYVKELYNYYDKREADQIMNILLEYLFEITRNELIMSPDVRLSESEILKLHMAVKQLLKMKPVQYITGEVEFMDLKFKVNSDVLIPRQETEELIHLILNTEKGNGFRILDIGTGSGCIAISLFSKLINPEVFAMDISLPALKVAKENAVMNSAKISFINHDILKPLNVKKFKNLPIKKLDFIISNPPYVTNKDKLLMSNNVLEFEPHEALFVPDNDPLIYYEAVLKFADIYLKPAGRIYFEINESYSSEMKTLFDKFSYADVTIHKDLRGKERFITGKKD